MVPVTLIRDHNVALADELRTRTGQREAGRPVVSLSDPTGQMPARLSEHGATVASRAGRVRIAFHIWNSQDDVDLAAAALRSVTTRH